jgi:Tfp pilus assembly protein PilX
MKTPEPQANDFPKETAMRPGPRRRQEGVVLMISLIMLVAMSLAGVALMRSVETAVIVAGNFAFKEAGIQVADRGVQEAARWISVNSGGNVLYNDNAPAGYSSSLPAVDPDYFDIDAWSSSVLMNSGTPDASGNIVRYVIHRMCTLPATPWDDPLNECGKQTSRATSEGGSKRRDAPQFEGPPILYYRVTTRVDGPRNTVTVIQTSIAVPI